MISSRSPLSFEKSKVEDIDRERIVVFIGISLLLSLTVNWQLNVYAHETPSTHTLCKGGWVGGVGWGEVDSVFSRFRRFRVDGQTIKKRSC